MTTPTLRSSLLLTLALLPACLPDGDASCGTWHWDADGDGYDAEYATCQPPAEALAGEAGAQADCDDTLPAVNPGALDGTSVCDGLDDDCDGEIDEDRTEGGWWPDADNDGYGDATGAEVGSCDAGFGYVENADDCDDADPAVPAYDALDACGDAVDADCDGADDVCALSGTVTLETLLSQGDAVQWSGERAVALGDTNGDGFADFALGNPSVDQVTLVFGGADGLSTRTLSGDVDGAFGTALAAGDFDGDGDTDLAVGAPDAESGAGEIVLYAGPDFNGVTVLAAAREDAQVGASLTSLPGTTGDGLATTVVRAYEATGEEALRVLVITTPMAETRARGVEVGAYEVGYAGLDLSADPTGQQLSVGVPLTMDVPWVGAELYALPATGDVDPVATIGEAVEGTPNTLGNNVAMAQLSSGSTLLFAGDYIAERAYAWPLPASGALGTADAALEWTGPQDSNLGTAVALVGDLDGSGTDDLVLGGEGQLWILSQGADGLQAGSVETLASGTVTGFDEVVWDLAAVGDVDGDGYADLVVIDDASVWLLFGGPS